MATFLKSELVLRYKTLRTVENLEARIEALRQSADAIGDRLRQPQAVQDAGLLSRARVCVLEAVARLERIATERDVMSEEYLIRDRTQAARIFHGEDEAA